jgi:hypothetical protein
MVKHSQLPRISAIESAINEEGLIGVSVTLPSSASPLERAIPSLIAEYLTALKDGWGAKKTLGEQC